ncbi:hypothetical protein [Arthrobacter sp. ISL-28]|uniref:hypothetical protein n=1 Tax=Arthrobacter sp. ISL-28 TaxID=2819108 RepID=UPI001BE96981|nr:hypothetical protein [Arthrobacter sp. ISL-28]MBT2519469.1 hypothetical protein [Arthrobacter sp. ISL-28]
MRARGRAAAGSQGQQDSNQGNARHRRCQQPGEIDGFLVRSFLRSGSTQQLKHLPNVSKWTCEEKGKPAINGITLPNVQEALTQLDSKRIDGVFYDASALAWAQVQQPDYFTVLEGELDCGDQ